MVLGGLRSQRARGMIWLGVTVYSAFSGRWDVALFLCGMVFGDADIRLAMATNLTDQPSSMEKPNELDRSLYRRYLLGAGKTAILVAGLWLASFPDRRASEAIGFGLLGAIHPSKEPWQAIGAALIVWSVRRVRPVRKLLTTSPLQYLGQVSFAFYIVHEPLLQVFGWVYTGMMRKYFILAAVEVRFSEEIGAQMGIWLAFISLTPVVFIFADYAWRGLDKPSMSLSKAIGKRI
jgi:peptidoglycan/LPS O-acetylase OafA/YrhL